MLAAHRYFRARKVSDSTAKMHPRKNGIVPPSNFLVCAGDDEVGVIHGNEVSSKLT